MISLEFCIPMGESARLFRLSALGRRTGRSTPVNIVWHDTADGALDADGLSLAELKGLWQLERSRPVQGHIWAPGAPAPLIEEAASLDAIGHALPGPLMPLAGFQGRRRTAQINDEAALTLLEGAVRGVSEERAVSRIRLTGPAPLLLSLSGTIAQTIPLSAPRWSLAAEAIALARGVTPAARQSGAPTVPAELCLRDAVTLVLSHLTDVILAGVTTAAAGESAEPVHQMRVAVRRLRSALSIFKRAGDEAAFAAVAPGLKQLAAVLGGARDWDVFLNGAGADVNAALPDDRRIVAMLEVAQRRRATAYVALRRYLSGPDFRALELALVQLCGLRTWHMAATDEQRDRLDAPAGDYAGHLLKRRLEHMLAPGPHIDALPPEELHAIRKQGKRLRYAAEFFMPIYGKGNGGKRSGRRFIGRLSTLQEVLGHLNDGASIKTLLAELGGGPERQFAAGAVQGFVAAGQGDARHAIARAWSKLRRQEPFWA